MERKGDITPPLLVISRCFALLKSVSKPEKLSSVTLTQHHPFEPISKGIQKAARRLGVLHSIEMEGVVALCQRTLLLSLAIQKLVPLFLNQGVVLVVKIQEETALLRRSLLKYRMTCCSRIVHSSRCQRALFEQTDRCLETSR